VLVHGGGFLPYAVGRLSHGREARGVAPDLLRRPEEYLDRFFLGSEIRFEHSSEANTWVSNNLRRALTPDIWSKCSWVSTMSNFVTLRWASCFEILPECRSAGSTITAARLSGASTMYAFDMQ